MSIVIYTARYIFTLWVVGFTVYQIFCMQKTRESYPLDFAMIVAILGVWGVLGILWSLVAASWGMGPW